MITPRTAEITMTNSSRRTAWVYLCKARPQKSGGGLGVAYNHLSAIHGKSAPDASIDAFLLCGCQLTHLPADSQQPFDDFIEGLEPGLKPGPRLLIRQVLMIRSLARRYRKVIVLSFTPFYFWPFVKVGLGGRVFCIHSEHSKGGRHHELAEEKGEFGFKEKFVRAAVWANFIFADCAVFPSAGSIFLFQDMNPRLSARVGRMSRVVHNGVEPVDLPSESERTSEDGSLRIVSIAHHVREKGLNTVLDTLASPELADIPWKFVNFGSHSGMTPELAAQSVLLGIDDRVELAGLKPQREVRETLVPATAFLHLPVVVVFDLSLLEAMMCGTPVITTPLPGNIEALGSDYPFYAETAAEAARKLRRILDNPAEAEQTGAALRTRAQELFTRQAMAGRYESLLLECSVEHAVI